MSRTILITGGSRGIGRATATLAGKLGWNVGVNYVGNADAAEVGAAPAARGVAAEPGEVALVRTAEGA